MKPSLLSMMFWSVILPGLVIAALFLAAIFIAKLAPGAVSGIPFLAVLSHM